MPRSVIVFLCLQFLALPVFAQHIGSSLPKKWTKTDKFLFYLHGGVVTMLGNNAINQAAPEWGPYEYLNILDSLKTRGFTVISENRRDGVDDSVYVNRIVHQIDTLLKVLNPKSILLVGASAGSNIVLHVSSKLKNKALKFAVMGGCWPDTYKEYETLQLYGHFFSIIEATDPHGTCQLVFANRKTLTSFEEIALNTGLSHGFLYKGYREWIDPLLKWYKE